VAARATSAGVRIRAYNVRFGDCVLVSFGARDAEKHVLIDFGNSPSMVRRQGGRNDVFAPVARDLARRAKPRIDLLVMSHEHLDHMEGFFSERGVFDGLPIGEVWMPAMSAPDYYRRHPNCEPERRARLALLDTALRWEADGRFARLPEPLRALVANNVLALANEDRIDYLRKRVPKKALRYLSRRRTAVRSAALGSGVEIEVLAPERDASVYYGARDRRFWLDVAGRLGATTSRRRKPPAPGAPKSPRHMAPDEFAALRDAIGELDLAALLAIDKAANNTSLVLRITIGGKVLLFPGDAEAESWAIMKAKQLLCPVDFLNLAHHGSGNGMPFEGEADVLGLLAKPRRKTVALVSTCRGVYGDTRETEIPQHRLMDRLATICAKCWVTEDAASPGQGFEIPL